MFLRFNFATLHSRHNPSRVIGTATKLPSANCGATLHRVNTAIPIPAFTISIIASVNVSSCTARGASPAGVRTLLITVLALLGAHLS